MITPEELYALQQEAISSAYSKLSPRDMDNVDKQCKRLMVIPGIEMRDARYILAMLNDGMRHITQEAKK